MTGTTNRHRVHPVTSDPGRRARGVPARTHPTLPPSRALGARLRAAVSPTPNPPRPAPIAPTPTERCHRRAPAASHPRHWNPKGSTQDRATLQAGVEFNRLVVAARRDKQSLSLACGYSANISWSTR